MPTYEEIMIEKYRIKNESVAADAFRAIPLSTLNDWLKKLSLNDETAYIKGRINATKKIIEEKYQAYLNSIKVHEELITTLETEIIRLNALDNKNLNKRAERIHKIIEEAISQNPDIAADQAKDLLIGKTADPVININSLSTLLDEEKEELYQIFIDEFKRLAGLM